MLDQVLRGILVVTVHVGRCWSRKRLDQALRGIYVVTVHVRRCWGRKMLSLSTSEDVMLG